jgi:hypothetical protein
MALTPAEQQELDQLQAEERAYDDEHKGLEAVDKVDAQRTRTSATRPFSLYRATVGAVRDAAQNVFDFVEDAGDELQRRAPLPVIRFGHDASNGLVDVVTGKEATEFTDRTRQTPELPTLKGEANAGAAERVTRAIGSFVVPFSLVGRTLGLAKGASWLGRAGKAMAAGAVVDATMDPKTTNLANVMRDTFGIDNKTLDELASEDDDNRLVARFKAAAVNAPLSLLTDAVFEAGLRGVRAYRAWRGSLSEADAAVRAVREELPVKAPQEPVEESFGGSATSAPKAASKAAEGASTGAPEDIEGAFEFLRRKVGEGASDEEVADIAERLTRRPDEALSASGINPLKVDFSALDDPNLLGRLHAGLQEVYEGIAQRLGRTGITVTEQMTARAARVMATSADVLKDLYGHTANLDSIMYASQTVVGAHAQKLMGLAERAIQAAKTGGPEAEQAWMDFLEAFHRHAYFLGALRGAGSEVGRALRSLQMVQKIGKKTAGRGLKEAVDNAAKADKGAAASRELAAMATDQVSKMADPAERILFLGKLIDSGGDVGDLSRFVRATSGSTLRRLDASTGELRGNLFAAITGVTNALSTLTIVGLRGTSMGLAALKAMAMSPLGKTYSQAARVQNLVTWAYVDGTLGAWRDAWRNTLSLLEREGMEEVVLNAEGWGAKGLATKAATLADEGRRGVKGNFERVDISSRTRALALTEADMSYLREAIGQWNTPALMQHSMTWLLKAARPAINAFGSLSRLGTILFVNGADQLMGTVAARAGAQAEAMRIAAHEAAELQLEGKALGQYMKARMVQLTETVDGFADDAYSAGQRQAALAAGEVEARGALFQDDLEFGGLSYLVGAATRTPMLHLFVPFVKTPLRILERTALDYTPLGLLKDRVRADILAGGARRDEALARIGLGMTMVYTAFSLAEERGIVGLDGDYSSSARLSRPSYSLRLGDDQIEFKRFDPVGTLLGWGADLRAYLDHEADIPPEQRPSTPEQIIEAAVFATQANVLSKTWLTSLRDLVQLASDVKQGQSADGWARYLQSFATRFVPASGIQRSLGQGFAGVDREAAGFIEGLLKQSFGSAKLPIKRDPLLGRPVPIESGQRLFGLKAGPGASDVDSPLLAELERLSFDIGKPSHSLYGVRLNSAQYSRFLELRGQVVTDPRTGMTLEGALKAVIGLPEYKALPRAGKVQAIRDVMNGYSQQASIRLIQEDHELARQIGTKQVFDQGLLTGASQGEIDRQTEELFKQLGLTGDDQTNLDEQ